MGKEWLCQQEHRWIFVCCTRIGTGDELVCLTQLTMSKPKYQTKKEFFLSFYSKILTINGIFHKYGNVAFVFEKAKIAAFHCIFAAVLTSFH